MGTLLENFNARYEDTGLKNKVTAAIAAQAQAILSEDGGTANHANRLIWAKRVISGQETATEADKFMWPVIGLGTITGNSSDQDIIWAVTQFIDLFATGA